MPEAIHQLLILFDDLSVLVPPIEPVLRKEVRQCSEYLQATRTHSLPSFRTGWNELTFTFNGFGSMMNTWSFKNV